MAPGTVWKYSIPNLGLLRNRPAAQSGLWAGGGVLSALMSHAANTLVHDRGETARVRGSLAMSDASTGWLRC